MPVRPAPSDRLAHLLAALLILAAAAGHAAPASYAESEFAAVEKIDVHMHLYGEMPVFAARAGAARRLSRNSRTRSGSMPTTWWTSSASMPVEPPM